MPSKAILKIAERNIPSLLELFMEEKELCAMFESQYIGELGDFHSVAEAEARANRYFSGLAARKARNDVSAKDDRAVLESGSANFGTNIIGVSLYIKCRQFSVVLDFYSGLGVELLALVNHGFDYQFRREGQPCCVQC